MKKVLLFLIVILIPAVGGYFLFQYLESGNISLQLPLQKKSFGVQAQLSELSKTDLVTTQGGSLTLEDNQVNIANLSFPEMSVLGAADITLSQIQLLNGLPQGATLVSGVQIDSSEDQLGELATLTLNLPEEYLSKKLVGFVYDSKGENFRSYPVDIKNEQAIFPIYHFSGYGIISVDDSYKIPPTELQIKEESWVKIKEILVGSEEVSEEQAMAILEVMKDWYERGVKPELKAANQNDEKVIDAVHGFLVWLQVAQSFKMDDEGLKAEVEEGLSLSAQAIYKASQKSSQKCTQEKDPSQVGRLIKLAALSQLMGLEKLAGINTEEITNNALKCANFELRFTSEMDENSVAGRDRFGVSGVIPLTMDSSFALSGEGEIEGKIFEMWQGMSCTRSGPEIYHAKIHQTKFTVAEKPEVTLLFDLGEDLWLTLYCVDPETGGTVEDDGVVWDEDFAYLHQGERVKDSIFKISGWDILGKGEIYAKKTYQRTQTIGATSITENTVIELIHKPR